MTTHEPEKVVLLHVDFSSAANVYKNTQEDLCEFKELAESAGAKVVDVIIAHKQTPDSKFFVGKGKVDEIKQHVDATNAVLVLVNHNLNPSQERNLEKILNCRVLDRTGLILDIFAERARSFEGKLQVELARLEYLATRLVRGWTHLERQKGGIGLRGGPGEKQLEIDQRLLRKRITIIKERLEKVRMQRAEGRRARKRNLLPIITMVGYTNAGKSTLFNTLTAEHVYVADKLFATLDPTLRGIDLPSFGRIIIADTVGFIRHLPHALVDAFRATLEETREARLLLHVIDASDPDCEKKVQAVNAVLQEIGADKVQQLLVYNKIDLLKKKIKPHVDYLDDGSTPYRIWMSAQTGAGKDLLLNVIKHILTIEYKILKIKLGPQDAALRAYLYGKGAVQKERVLKNGYWSLTLAVSEEVARKMKELKYE